MQGGDIVHVGHPLGEFLALAKRRSVVGDSLVETALRFPFRSEELLGLRVVTLFPGGHLGCLERLLCLLDCDGEFLGLGLEPVEPLPVGLAFQQRHQVPMPL